MGRRIGFLIIFPIFVVKEAKALANTAALRLFLSAGAAVDTVRN